MMRKFKKFIIILLFGIAVVNPVLVMAQSNANTTTKVDVTEYQGVQGSLQSYLCTPSATSDGKDLERCINKLYRFGISFGAIALVFFLVFAGYMYITGGETGKSKAKSILGNAVIGMALLLGSYLLLGFINPNLLLFKPVQPPIFGAEDLATCQDLGLGTNCTIDVHGSGVENVGTGGSLPHGTATACKGGLISTPSAIPHTSGASTICKDLADKLLGLKAKTGNIGWVLSSTISGTHSSSCHGSGNANSGNCADIALNGGRNPSYDKDNGGSTNPDWGKMCTAIASLGGVNFANEASNQAACQQLKPYHVETYTTGPNLHTNYIGP